MAKTGAALDFTMKDVHNVTTNHLRAGARQIDWATAADALVKPGWFRFTTIREPVSRTVSAWADKIHGGKSRIRNDFMHHIGRNQRDNVSLSEFLDILANDRNARDLDRHWRPQHKEISYGLVPYDVIGRVEALDVARNAIVAALFGSRALSIKEIDTRKALGHQSGSREFHEALTARDRRNIERAFERDFVMYETVEKAEDIGVPALRTAG